MAVHTCQITGDDFNISEAEIDFRLRNGFPIPNVSPVERFRFLAAFHNDTQLYLRTCEITGQPILSSIPHGSYCSVITLKHWRSSDFDALSYGYDFNFKRRFFEQLFELWVRVPRPATFSTDTSRSRGVHNTTKVKDCVLVFDTRDCSNCFYSSDIRCCDRCVDCYQCFSCKQCYECILCTGCYRLRWSNYSANCRDSWFLTNCNDCENCFACCDLTGKQYHIFNQPLDPEEYFRTLKNFGLDSRPTLDVIKNRIDEFIGTQATAHILADQLKDVTGNYLIKSQFIEHSFECFDCNNLFNCHNLFGSQFCIDGFHGDDVSYSSQFVSVGNQAKYIINSYQCWNSVEHLTYCSYCENSSNLIGCVGLRNKQFCIFNKQYSESDYFKLKNKIEEHSRNTKEWGMFFPPIFSCYTYNQSAAESYMPLGKVQAQLMDFRWDEIGRVLKPSKLLNINLDSGDSLQESSASIYAEVPDKAHAATPDFFENNFFLCEISGIPYQITPFELEFYLDMEICLPLRSFNQRHRDRLSRTTPHSLITRKCVITGEEIKSAFPLRWKQSVYKKNL